MSDEPMRVILEGVPRVTFHAAPGHDAETVPFPSCLRACLDFMGEGMGRKTIMFEGKTYQQNIAYTYLMGTSGAAFRLVWRRGWHPDNVDIVLMAQDPLEPYRRAFDSVGFEFEIVEEHRADEAAFRQHIITQIRDKNRPVLAFGVIGPPECCLVTGYDAGGDVLIGWNFFQDIPPFNAGVEYEPSGEFRKRNWYPETPALYLIADKKPRPPLGDIYRGALQWALTILRTPQVRGRFSGLAAYDAWAEQLGRDDDLATDDMAVLRECHMTHHDAVGTVAEGRWYAACFLKQIAENEPGMAAELLDAAACFQAEHDLMWKIWNLMGGLGFEEAKVKQFAEPEVRRQMIPLIREARDKDAAAASHIERALSQ
jgi:hypothetical protein